MSILIGIIIFVLLFPLIAAIAGLMRSSTLSQREEQHDYQSESLESVKEC